MMEKDLFSRASFSDSTWYFGFGSLGGLILELERRLMRRNGVNPETCFPIAYCRLENRLQF